MAIYFIANEASKAIKIGFTDDDPIKRASQLQTGSCDLLSVVGVIPGSLADENRWHERWDHLRMRGEWFRYDRHLLDLIARRVADVGIPLPGRAKPRDGFRELAEIEPYLWGLYREALAYRIRALMDDEFCANGAWYGYDGHSGIKPRLLGLVGWCRPDKHPELKTMRAYDIAYHSIYEALPDCKDGCACQAVLSACLEA